MWHAITQVQGRRVLRAGGGGSAARSQVGARPAALTAVGGSVTGQVSLGAAGFQPGAVSSITYVVSGRGGRFILD